MFHRQFSDRQWQRISDLLHVMVAHDPGANENLVQSIGGCLLATPLGCWLFTFETGPMSLASEYALTIAIVVKSSGNTAHQT
jgi:hypothetical protein